MPPRIAIFAATLLLGCGPQASPVPRPIAGTGRTPVTVQRFAAQPRFTSLYREGDPYAVLSLAVATGLSAGPNAALAAIVESRLQGREADVVSDGLALRITLPLRGDAGELLAALAASLSPELTPGERTAARAAWQRRAPLADAALQDWAHCAGSPERERDASPPDDTRLRGWLAQLSTDRLGLAFVGPAATGDAVAAALPQTTGWPQGKASAHASPQSSHHAFVGGQALLRLGLYHGDAVAVVEAAHGLEGASPLAHHLALLDPPWQLVTAEATAHAKGGCLHVSLAPAGPASSKQGAEAAAVAERDLRAALQHEPTGFAATREILGGGDVHETARRAAWWALTEPREQAPVAVSALELAPSPARAPAAVDKAHRDAEQNYREALRPARAVAPAAQTIAVEPGQGGVWMLAAQPCALLDEGAWDAGQAALAAAAVAADARGDVKIEPWVTTQGVGLVAHALPRHAGEPPDALARRVGDALGRHLTAMPTAMGLMLARREVLSLLADERANLTAAFGERVTPGHPSWLLPWGLRDRVGDAEIPAVRARWRDVLTGGPWRVATLAHDEAVAKTAMAALQPWLPATPSRCAAEPPAGKPDRSPVHVPSSAPGATVLRAYPVKDVAMARLTAAAATPRLEALPFSAGAQVIDGARPVLVFWGQGASVDRDAIASGLAKLVASLASLNAVELASARKRLAHMLEAARRSPRERLAQLWRGATPTVPDADASVVNAWVKRLGTGTEVTDR